MMEFSIDEDKVSPLQISYITCHLQCSNGVILICCFPGFVKETRKWGKTKFDKLKCFQESLTTNALPCSATITPPPPNESYLLQFITILPSKVTRKAFILGQMSYLFSRGITKYQPVTRIADG